MTFACNGIAEQTKTNKTGSNKKERGEGRGGKVKLERFDLCYLNKYIF